MKKETTGRESYGKYFIFGIVAAIVLYLTFSIYKNENVPENNQPHIWAAATDSQFVKSCYDKYKPQIKDDLQKQEITKIFCKCMLEKIKTKYDETEMNNVKNDEIKKWDTECRAELSNPMFLK